MRRLLDYLALTKPIIMILLLMTTLAATFVASGGMPPLDLLLWTMVGGALSSGGASALNQYIDRDLDGAMARTAKRPIPSGRIQPTHALIFGLTLSVLSLVVFVVFVNWLAALMSLIGHLYYVVFYTMYLKRATPQNIVIGGAAGRATVGGLGGGIRRDQHPRAVFVRHHLLLDSATLLGVGIGEAKRLRARTNPMLPVVWGEVETRKQIALYSLILVALTLLLTPANVTGMFYMIAASVLGLILLVHAVMLMRGGTNIQAWRMYKYSSYYLALLFAAMVVDQFI